MLMVANFGLHKIMQNIKNLCVLVLWTKVASALEGLKVSWKKIVRGTLRVKFKVISRLQSMAISAEFAGVLTDAGFANKRLIVLYLSYRGRISSFSYLVL